MVLLVISNCPLFRMLRQLYKRGLMKKYLLLIEDEKLWEKFKNLIKKDLNTEILELIKEKTSGRLGGRKNHGE